MTTMATHTGARAWNLNAQHRPVAVVMAEQADDVVEAVRLGREHDLGVGVMATGHGTSTANEGVLVNTSRMRAVRVDPGRRSARVQAGALWSQVIDASAPHGLTGLPGSSPASASWASRSAAASAGSDGASGSLPTPSRARRW